MSLVKFIPNTPTVNPDKEYFTYGAFFIKRDFNISRGIKEAFTLMELDSYHFPKVHKLEVTDKYSELWMTRLEGQTLENCDKSLLTNFNDQKSITDGLMDIYSILQSKNLVHGDINESNLIYNQRTSCLHLIDFEFAVKEISQRDLTGPNWGIIHVLKWLNA